MNRPELRRVERERIAGSQDRPAITGEIPGKAGARTEVVRVGVVHAVDAAANTYKTAVLEEIRCEAIALGQRLKDLVPDSGAERQPRIRLPVVVDVRAVRVLMHVALGRAEGARCPVEAGEQQAHER